MWQQKGDFGEFDVVDSLGRDLSSILNCPIRYCAWQYEKPVFECRCNITFPKFAVEVSQRSGDWLDIIKRHREGF
ncbi:MAG: hypothetical protein WC389_12935 [Lutibacter sp.]|jgi:hypothetical protein